MKLDVRLSVLKKPFAEWNAAVLKEMDTRTAVIKRGWDESGMGRAMDLAESKGANCEEYRVAERMEEAGTLFEKFTMKEKADLAEALLSARFNDLMGDEVDDEVDRAFTMDELQQLDNMNHEEGAAAEGEEAATEGNYTPFLLFCCTFSTRTDVCAYSFLFCSAEGDFTWDGSDYQDIMPTLQAQGRQFHLQSLSLVDETAAVNQTNQKKRR